MRRTWGERSEDPKASATNSGPGVVSMATGTPVALCSRRYSAWSPSRVSISTGSAPRRIAGPVGPMLPTLGARRAGPAALSRSAGSFGRAVPPSLSPEPAVDPSCQRSPEHSGRASQRVAEPAERRPSVRTDRRVRRHAVGGGPWVGAVPTTPAPTVGWRQPADPGRPVLRRSPTGPQSPGRHRGKRPATRTRARRRPTTAPGPCSNRPARDAARCLL